MAEPKPDRRDVDEAQEALRSLVVTGGDPAGILQLVEAALDHAQLACRTAFNAFLQPLRRIDWVVYAKEPFAGPRAVLAYLSRYTHRVAISNSRLIRMDERGITFRVKDYRVKTDRRDAEMLARLWRAGELTAIWTPDEEQEAMRDLIRTRKQAMDALKAAKQHLQSFLFRHGLSYRNGIYWTKRHRRWLAELRRFPYPHQQLAFEELKRAIDQIEARVSTRDNTIEEAVSRWRFAPVVDALRALRGVNTTIAATVVAEIGDITRFETPVS